MEESSDRRNYKKQHKYNTTPTKQIIKPIYHNEKEDDEKGFDIYSPIVGTCPSMCPDEERLQRERLRDLSVFERLNGSPVKTSPTLAVKKVRFYVISHHKLRKSEGSSNAASSMHFLNMEQPTKTLTSLYNLYEAIRKSQSAYDNEAEFRSLYVLLHLGHDRKPMVEPLSLWFRQVSPSTLKLKEMVFARKVLRLYNLGNYKCFISMIAAEASHMQYCVIEPFISEVRALAICCVNYGGYKLHPSPVEDLSNFLKMEESDVESFCKACGLEIVIDEFGKRFLPTKQTSFCHPKGGLQNYNLVGFEIS